jgi:hypothetical protein
LFLGEEFWFFGGFLSAFSGCCFGLVRASGMQAVGDFWFMLLFSHAGFRVCWHVVGSAACFSWCSALLSAWVAYVCFCISCWRFSV